MRNVSVVGRGNWGSKILKTLKEIDDVNVCEVLGKNYKLAKTSDLDIVFIATPDETHYEIASYFLDKNINVFLEKPLTGSLQKSLELKKRVNNSIVVVDDIFLHSDCLAKIKTKTDIKKINLTRTNESFVGLNRVLTSLLYHDLYIVDHILGDIRNASGVKRVVLCGGDIEKISFNINNTSVRIVGGVSTAKVRVANIDGAIWDQVEKKVYEKDGSISCTDGDLLKKMILSSLSRFDKKDSNIDMDIRVMEFIETCEKNTIFS